MLVDPISLGLGFFCEDILNENKCPNLFPWTGPGDSKQKLSVDQSYEKAFLDVSQTNFKSLC